MAPNFKINRPPISDDEIEKHKNFEKLLEQFKSQSLQKAQLDKSWWKKKYISYSAVIVGITVLCTITLKTLHNINNSIKKNTTLNENTITKTNLIKPNTSVKQKIIVPIKKLETPFSIYKIKNQTEQIIKHNHSQIKIPANSIVNAEGELIEGEITILYREHKDLGDIMLSGIPMKIDSAGIVKNFESAGMFEINITQNTKQLHLKKGERIEVKLASLTAENKFNQYYFDTLEGNWQYLNTCVPEFIAKNAGKISATNVELKITELKNQIEKVIPHKIDSVKTTYTQKIEKLPKLKEPVKIKKLSGRPVFNLDGNFESIPELQAYKNVQFEVGEENKNYTNEIHQITWQDISLTQGPKQAQNYLLTMYYGKRIEKLIVYPVLQGKDYDAATALYNKKFNEYTLLKNQNIEQEQKLLNEMNNRKSKYENDLLIKQVELDKAVVQIKLEQDKKQKEAGKFAEASANALNAYRTFSISKLGIYNSDCAKSLPNGKYFNPRYVHNNVRFDPNHVFLIDKKNNQVFNITRSENRMIINEKGEYSICVILGSKIFKGNNENIKQLLKNNLNEVKLDEVSETCKSTKAFKEVFGI
ncbi:MAG: hypothetical protein JSU07_10565 [Bacteroidetes bacterium]|nr:hypothetical protein [Bacteroidota bacterium]